MADLRPVSHDASKWWAILLLVLMAIGAIGLFIVAERLDRGDPNRQFEWPRWMGRSS